MSYLEDVLKISKAIGGDGIMGKEEGKVEEKTFEASKEMGIEKVMPNALIIESLASGLG